MYHFPNHIDVVFPYTHTHTVLVHVLHVCKLLYNTDAQSDTNDIRLISVHILRTELQVSMGSAAPPDFGGKFFNIIRPLPILAAVVVKVLTL